MSIRPCIYDKTRPCICKAVPQNLTDCRLASSYRRSVQPRWYERIVFRLVAFLMRRW